MPKGPIRVAPRGRLIHVLAARTKACEEREQRKQRQWDLNYQLFCAAGDGKVREVRRLLKMGAESDFDEGVGDTPLTEAVFYGHKKIAAILIGAQGERAGCTSSSFGFVDHYLDKPSEECGTPLIIAAEHGDKEMVEFLVREGANPCAEAGESDTPLHIAAQNNDMHIMRLLMKRLDHMEAEEDCFSYPPLDVPNGNSETPLYLAAGGGHLKMAKMLLSAGAAVNDANADDDTPLHVAARRGRVAVVSTLLSAGAKVDATNEDGETPLLAALSNGHQAVASRLLAAGAVMPKKACGDPNKSRRSNRGKARK